MGFQNFDNVLGSISVKHMSYDPNSKKIHTKMLGRCSAVRVGRRIPGDYDETEFESELQNVYNFLDGHRVISRG